MENGSPPKHGHLKAEFLRRLSDELQVKLNVALHSLEPGSRMLTYEEDLGAGTFGTVVKAWCQASGKGFAVKRANDVSWYSVRIKHSRMSATPPLSNRCHKNLFQSKRIPIILSFPPPSTRANMLPLSLLPHPAYFCSGARAHLYFTRGQGLRQVRPQHAYNELCRPRESIMNLNRFGWAQR